MADQVIYRDILTSKEMQIFIDPSYAVFNEDKLFSLKDPVLNRDNQLLPFYRASKKVFESGGTIHTADHLIQLDGKSDQAIYYSLGLLDSYKKIHDEGLAKLEAFVIMEPPVVAPHLYAKLPELTSLFENVYVHNIDGDGYSLAGVLREKLRKFYYPIPYDDVIESYWSNQDRLKKIVVINGSHKPQSRAKELYSARINAIAELSKFGAIDLYGQGWNKWWSRNALWVPYWINRNKLMKVYKGPCASKFEVFKRYDFCLCLENMAMDGYITEKIFDCLYSGTIPLYLGAPDISEYVDSDAYIDCRKFSSWSELWKHVSSISQDEIQRMREAGRAFIGGAKAKPFFNSIENLVGLSDK
jgi:hypothetical protein